MILDLIAIISGDQYSSFSAEVAFSLLIFFFIFSLSFWGLSNALPRLLAGWALEYCEKGNLTAQ